MLPFAHILLVLSLIISSIHGHPLEDSLTDTWTVELDQQHSVSDDAGQVYFGSTSPHSESSASRTLKAVPTLVYQPAWNSAYQDARISSLEQAMSRQVEWIPRTLAAPDVQDRHTLVELAKMAGNAYALPGHSNWYDLDGAWNQSFPFGWEDDQNGFRGHVFKSKDNSTVVLAIKGTTVQGETSKKDKFNDNLLFSCCCARVDFSWVFRTVCDCYSGAQRCDSTCLSRALIQDSLFYSTGVRIINELIAHYPGSNIWLVGHSLGGSLASLLGSTFGFPAVAFEAPGELLAARRLHLPLPPPLPSDSVSDSDSDLLPPPVPVTHVFHTADPIPLGTCTGFNSPCERAGYADRKSVV